MNPGTPSVRLTSRDLGLLKDLARFGVLSFTQVQARHFAKAAVPTVCNRLSQLAHAGYVSRMRIGREIYHGKSKIIGTVYRMTRAGLATVRAYSPDAPVPARPVPLNPTNLSHDLLLVDVVGALERRFSGARISPGHLNGREGSPRGRCPDAIVEFQATSRRVAVELELTAKSARRYRDIVTSYRLLPAFDEVLYVVGSQAIRDAVKAQVLGYKPRPGLPAPSTGKFRFVLLNELLEGPESMPNWQKTETEQVSMADRSQPYSREVNACHSK